MDCEKCGKSAERLFDVLVMKRTHSSPAEYEGWCGDCIGGEAEDDPHERAAARARSNDFADTNGRDWT